MPKALRASVATVALAVMAAAPVSFGINVLTPDTAYANPGKGNDKGNGGNGNGHSKSSENRGQAKKAERQALMDEAGVDNWGAIASELGALNAAHANQTALENASPDSMPGKLYVYQETDGITVDGIIAYNEANTLLNDEEAQKAKWGDEYDAYVDGLEQEDTNGDGVIDENDDPVVPDDFATWLADSGYLDEPQDIKDYYQDAYEALAAVKDGTLSLTQGAIDALNQMLGLDPAEYESTAG